MEVDHYCKIYLNPRGRFESGDQLEEIRKIAASTTGGVVQGRSVIGTTLIVDVFQSSEAGGNDGRGSFVTWPIYLEVELSDEAEISDEKFVLDVRSLLFAFRSSGIEAEPSCTFEELLK